MPQQTTQSIKRNAPDAKAVIYVAINKKLINYLTCVQFFTKLNVWLSLYNQ